MRNAAFDAVETVAGVGIPSMVALLGPQSTSAVQEAAAGALRLLACNADSGVKIAAAGAIPPLVALLGPQSTAAVQEVAAGALRHLAYDADNRVKIAAAGAIPPLVTMLGAPNEGAVQEAAALAIGQLALLGGNQVAIKACPHALSYLSKLKRTSTSAAVSQAAKSALQSLESTQFVARGVRSEEAGKISDEIIAAEGGDTAQALAGPGPGR